MTYVRIKCPKCEESFGQEAKFIDHLKNLHEIEDVLSLYLECFHNNIHPTCECSENCHLKLKYSGWKRGFTSKYARGHNAKIDSVYKKPERQVEFAKKRRDGYSSGKYRVWNSGLTKESDSRILEKSIKTGKTLKDGYASGKIIDWRLKDPNKADIVSSKISETKKRMFSNGILKSWNEGKTKLTCPSLASSAQKISESYRNPEMGRRIKQEELIERIQKYVDKFTLVSSPAEYKRRRIERLTFKCNLCGAIQTKSLAMLEESPICFSCAPRESKGQIEIYEFVKMLCNDAVLSDRTIIAPKEIDIYCPGKKLGIEFNGLFWHSMKMQPDSDYHVSKLDLCKKSGVSLLSIYEDEWRDKKDIVKGMIRHRLHSPIKVWDARKLSVVKLDSKKAKEFFNQNHLEGYTPSIVSFGLQDDNTGLIVAGMTLRRAFHKKYSNQFEVGRCCTLSGHSIRGWLGKLTSAAVSYAKECGKVGLMTYVDSRVGSGSGYEQAGWSCVARDSAPRFWWTDFRNRYNRFKYRADKKSGLSQEQVAEKAGVVMIWGCHNSRYEIMF